jgi:hypothetical protein
MSEKSLRNSLIRSISGFKPAMTGGICDSCNAGLSDGETVYVYARNGEEWRISRTSCSECGDTLDDRDVDEAIVKCELGYSPDGEFYPLHNPEIVELNTSGT